MRITPSSITCVAVSFEYFVRHKMYKYCVVFSRNILSSFVTKNPHTTVHEFLCSYGLHEKEVRKSSTISKRKTWFRGRQPFSRNVSFVKNSRSSFGRNAFVLCSRFARIIFLLPTLTLWIGGEPHLSNNSGSGNVLRSESTLTHMYPQSEYDILHQRYLCTLRPRVLCSSCVVRL